MEENKFFYSQRAILIATFFGSPLAAGILVRKNYINLGKDKEGLYALLIGIIATILLFIGIFAIPEEIMDKIPDVAIPFIYTGIIYLIVERIQGQELRIHKESKGNFYSAWKAAGIGVISMIVLIAGLFSYLYTTEKELDPEQFNEYVFTYENNEYEALDILENLVDDDVQAIEKLNKGLTLWRENVQIIKELNRYDLSSEDIAYHNYLIKYYKLQIEKYEIIIKSYSEDGNNYEADLAKLFLEFEELVVEYQTSTTGEY